MLTKRNYLRLLVSSIIASSPMLYAQTNEKNEDIEKIEIQGRYLSIDKVNSVKTPTPILDVPQSLSIILSEQLEKQDFRNMGDILRYTPGLAVSQGEGHRDAVIIRGIQTTADFFIDGIRDDVQYYRPLYNVEQIEVLRGSNALLFGRGGGGGVINRVQKKPILEENLTKIKASANTFGAYSASTDINHSISDNAAFRVNAVYEELENHRDFFEGETFAINPTLAVDFSDDTDLFLSYEYVDYDRTVDRGVPSQNVEDGPDIPLQGYRDTFFGSPDANITTLEAHIINARLEHNFNASMRGNVSVQFADYDKLYQNIYPSEEVNVVNGQFDEVELDGYRDPTTRENLIVQANLISEFETGDLGHTLLFGFEFGKQDTENARFDNVFALNSDDQLFIPFTDPLRIPRFAFSKLARDRSSEVEFTSVYLQDQIDLTENFKIVMGLRYDEFDIKVLDAIEANDNDNVDGNFERKDQEVTPRAGIIYKPQENVSLYASYSETFLPRSGEQFLTLNLDSESTRPQFFENKELGLKWDFTESMSLTTAIFSLERESYTSVDPDDPSQVIVIEGSETDGFELQLTGQVDKWWWVTAGYSYLDGEVKRVDGSGNNGNKTRQTPENMFSIWNEFFINDSLSLGLGVTRQDSFFVREDNSVEVPEYTRVDAAIYYDYNDDTRIQLNVENLFDRDYYPDAHSNDNISTGAPINARLSVSYAF